MRPRTSNKRKIPKRIPWLFGKGGREKVLICLAINGPMTVREIARALKVGSRTAWDIVDRLRRSNLVSKRDVPGFRKHVYVNRQLPVYGSLMSLLRALDRQFPAPRVSDYVCRWRIPYDRNMRSERLDRFFQSPLRSRVLLIVAATGEIDLKTIFTTLGTGAVSTKNAVNSLQKHGILRSRYFKGHRLIGLDPEFFAAKELYELLRAIVGKTPEYQAYRTIVRERLGPLIRDAGKW